MHRGAWQRSSELYRLTNVFHEPLRGLFGWTDSCMSLALFARKPYKRHTYVRTWKLATHSAGRNSNTHVMECATHSVCMSDNYRHGFYIARHAWWNVVRTYLTYLLCYTNMAACNTTMRQAQAQARVWEQRLWTKPPSCGEGKMLRSCVYA